MISKQIATNIFKRLVQVWPALSGPALVFDSSIKPKGHYTRSTNIVTINLDRINTIELLVQVIAHELYHGYDLVYDSRYKRELRASLFQCAALGYFKP